MIVPALATLPGFFIASGRRVYGSLAAQSLFPCGTVRDLLGVCVKRRFALFLLGIAALSRVKDRGSNRGREHGSGGSMAHRWRRNARFNFAIDRAPQRLDHESHVADGALNI